MTQAHVHHAKKPAALVTVEAAQSSATKFVRQHPLATAGVMLGSGVIIGAVAHALLEHKPTLSELLAKQLHVKR